MSQLNHLMSVLAPVRQLSELRQESVVYLELEGVDTVAQVLVGGTPVGNTDNMFVRYFFDISDVAYVSATI